MSTQEHRLEIIDIGAGGDGIARLGDGRAVFVPLTVTGDIVRATLEPPEGEGQKARLVSVERAGPHRAVPPCRHFGICGGCALQHLDGEAYRHFKVDAVVSALEKAGVKPPDTVDAAFIPPGTRRRANFAARVTRGKTIIGFHERKSANVRDVPDCLLITEELRAAMEAFRPHVAAIAGEGGRIDILIQCVDGRTEIGLTGKIQDTLDAKMALADAMRAGDLARISLRARDYDAYEILLDAKAFYKSFGDLTVNLAPGAFLQPSEEGEVALTGCVTGGAGDAARIADLFCGNGTFTGPLMDGRDIVAVDFAGDAIVALKSAGVKAQLRNLFKEPLTQRELAGCECVILDPPRAGAKAQVEVLAFSAIPKIVYVSCNPQSFARDAAILAGGGYALSRLTVVDQFVWSTHTEVAGVFEKH